jgi:heptosyltransferase-2
MQDKIFKVLVIRFSSLGDVILTTPVLDALKENYRDSEIYFLTKQKYQGLFEADPRINSVIYFQPEDKDKGVAGLFRLIKRLNQEKFDLIVDLHSNLRSFFIRTLVKAQKKARYNKRLITRLQMVYFKKWNVNSITTVESYLKSLEKIGIKIENRGPGLFVDHQEKIWAKQFLSQVGFKERELLVGIAPGAKWEMKKWGKDKFSSVAKKLSQDLPAKILLVGDKNDQNLIEDIKDYVGENKVIQAVNLPLDKLMVLIERCEAFISNDSGPMHLASALGVPTIGIFGPTSPNLGFSPSWLNDKAFWAGVECSPCSLHGKKECVREKRFCMDEIMPKEVMEEAKRIINADKVIFLDRDGTLTVEKDFVSEIEQVEFIPGTKEALKMLQELGYKLVIISNQSGIGRKIMTEKQVEKINDFILEEFENEGIKIEGIYYCPHHPENNCNCRKPKTGLIEKALLKHNLKLKGSWVIGDKLSDVLLGKNIRAKSILVLTGYGEEVREKIESSSEVYPWQRPDYIAKDLLDAALYIKSQISKKKVRKAMNNIQTKKG